MSESQESSGQVDESSADHQVEVKEPVKDSVAYDTYRKVLSEKKKRDEQLREAMDRVQKFELEAKEREESELKAKEDFKKLLELRDSELGEYKNKYSTLLNQQVATAKLTNFFDNLDGKVSKKYWDKIPLDDIVIDEESGEVDSSSVQRAIELFKKEYPEVIQTQSGPKVQSVSPTTAAVDTKDDVLSRIAKSGLF